MIPCDLWNFPYFDPVGAPSAQKSAIGITKFKFSILLVIFNGTIFKIGALFSSEIWNCRILFQYLDSLSAPTFGAPTVLFNSIIFKLLLLDTFLFQLISVLLYKYYFDMYLRIFYKRESN